MIKNILKFIVVGIFLFLGIQSSTAQTTIDFNENAIDREGLTKSYDNSGFNFSVDIDVASIRQIVVDVDGGLSGTSALFDNNLTVNGLTTWTIKKIDGEEFRFLSIYLQDAANGGSASGTITGFRDNIQVGTPVSVLFDSNTSGVLDFSGNSDFLEVDEIRIEGVDINFHLDNFVFGPTTVPVELTITADSNQSKVFGEADLVFSYTVSGFENGDDESILTGSLVREAGEDVDTYAINQGTVDAGSNYFINFISADFEIKPATLSITVDAGQSKEYGSTDPALTYTPSGFQNGDTDAILTGSLVRDAGEDVAIYAINQGTVDAGSNYTIDFTSADFEITTATLTITVDAGQTKDYGSADPVFTYSASGFQNGDTDAILTGSLMRDAGEDVATYAINQGTVAAGSNYLIDFTSADFEIKTATLTITVDAGQTKEYGSTDPALTYTPSGFQNGDTDAILTGSLVRDAGEDVAIYAINQGTLDAGPNYSINFTSADFEITPATLSITVDAGQSKEYGSTDPALTYTPSGFQNGDTDAILTGALVRDAGEDVAIYAINQGTVDAGSNYLIEFTSADFEITPATLTITVDAGQTKEYGSTDPALTYTPSGFQNGDTDAILTGSLVREAGEDVAIYAINQGTVDAGSNYTIDFTSADFEITPATLSITVDAGQSKEYGSTDPALTYTPSGFQNGDTDAILTGSLVRDAGEDVATYAINQGSVGAGSNYTINFTSDDFEIKKATITGITLDGNSFTYDGTAKSLAITGTLPIGTQVDYTNNFRTNVGQQEVTATITGLNYTTLELKANLTVSPATITGITFEGKSFPIDGTEKSLSISGALPEGTAVEYLNNGRSKLGVQEVTAIISGSNYVTLVLTANLEIIPGGREGKEPKEKNPRNPNRREIDKSSEQNSENGLSISEQVQSIESSNELRFGEFKMFPNPAESEVNIEVELDQSMNVGIRIFDSVGRLVHEEEGIQDGKPTYRISINHLSAGLYMVQVKTGQIVMMKRLIKK